MSALLAYPVAYPVASSSLARSACKAASLRRIVTTTVSLSWRTP